MSKYEMVNCIGDGGKYNKGCGKVQGRSGNTCSKCGGMLISDEALKEEKKMRLDEMKYEIEKLELKENDVIIVKLQRGNMPFDKMAKFMDNVKNNLASHFPNNKIIVTTDEFDIQTKEEEEYNICL